MPKKGYKWTDEHRRNYSKACKGTRKSKLKGRKVSKELVEKQRQGRLRWYETHRAWNLGISRTLDTRNRISKSMYLYWQRKKKEAKGAND